MQTFFDRPDPQPQDGEILIRVRAAGVARLDSALRSGHLPALNGHLPFPQVMGMEGAGDVLAVGAGVTDFRVGDAVFGFALSGAGTFVSYNAGDVADQVRSLDRPGLETVAALMVVGGMNAHITRTCAFDLAAVESGHAAGKLVITFPAG